MLAQFPVLAVDTVMRRTIRSCALFGGVAVAATIALGVWLAAPGVVLGLAAGIANQRVFLASASRFMTPEGKMSRRPFAGSVALRLAVITAVAFALLFVLRPMGWGMIGGLVAFQLLLMLNAMVALLHYQRQGGELGFPSGAPLAGPSVAAGSAAHSTDVPTADVPSAAARVPADGGDGPVVATEVPQVVTVPDGDHS